LGRSNTANLQSQAVPVINQTVPVVNSVPNAPMNFVPSFQQMPNQMLQQPSQNLWAQQPQPYFAPQMMYTQQQFQPSMPSTTAMPMPSPQTVLSQANTSKVIPSSIPVVTAPALPSSEISKQVEAASSSNNKYYIWIIIFLCVALVCFAFIAWMRGTKMKESYKEEENVSDEEEESLTNEEEEEYSADTREIPPPSSLKYNNNRDDKESKVQHLKEEDDDIISKNILNYAKGNYVDLSGFDLPFEERFPKFTSNKKIVADESQEVLDYAKRRESLFDEK
jgi:large-conductance mechanosensitive channel